MKNKFIIGIAAAGIFSLGFLAGCGGGQGGGSEVDFSFSISLESGLTYLTVGAKDQVKISTSGSLEGKTFTYTSTAPTIVTVSETGALEAKAVGNAIIQVKETTTSKSSSLRLTVSGSETANGGYNYASLAGDDAIKTRTEILGKLEKYSMDNHLTGITLFENGGYVLYNPRVSLPTTNYITGYGFGLLAEGEVTADLDSEENPLYKRYLHSASSSDPLTINEKNNNGSQVSDLAGYITSSYWGTKMNASKDGYDWYPVLAKDTITIDGASVAFNRPLPVYEGEIVKPNEEKNPLGLYNTWRIYVKNGADDGLKFRTLSSLRSAYDKRNVTIDDYEFAYRFLLTGANKQTRGTEMAGDTTYGIKGAQAFNSRTKESTDEQSKTLWDNMKTNGSLGIKTNKDTNGDYIELTILNPIDRFTAMYTLSSSLVSPLPEDFIKEIGDGSISKGAKMYGNFNNGTGTDNILDYTICVGPYMLEDWVKNQTIIFKKNETWFETNRYKIEGVKVINVKGATSDPDAIYKEFNAGKLDSCGVPTKHIAEEKNRAIKTKGDSTFKLNVNSCDRETWNYLFGPQGKINKNSSWDLKPWMSNDNFLNGLFYSIDRKTFAENRGVQPSINYFSDAYLSDPEKGVSYNSTDAHKEAVKAYAGADGYGYSLDSAIRCFKAAVNELAAKGDIVKGTKNKPTEIKIHIRWMYQTDIKEYGDEIKTYFESAFNNDAVSNGTVVLKVEQDAVTDWQEVYNEYLMKGQFDLGFGAISGNTYNPLNFLEVLRSDNSSGFTLNWGTDTSKVTTNKPLEYDDKLWSFDALWEVADHGGIVENGQSVKPVKTCYMELPTRIDTGAQTDKMYEGVKVEIPLEFVQVNDAEFDVSRVQIYIVGSGNEDVSYELSADKSKIIVTIPQLKAMEINDKIVEVNKLMDPSLDDSKKNPYPFVREQYGIYWTFEVYYTISIKKGTPSETFVTVASSKNNQDF